MPKQRTKPVHVPSMGMPKGAPPSREIYAAMGETGVFAMLAELYGELESSSVRHLFPADMQSASERSAAFFVQLLGGPALFSERFGPPRMRARHIPFEIDEQARAVWLECFERVLAGAPERHGLPTEHRQGLLQFLYSFSAWMVNVAPDQKHAGDENGIQGDSTSPLQTLFPSGGLRSEPGAALGLEDH